jgi:WD40 repeat protein
MPAGAEPLMLRWRYFSESLNGVAVDPSGRWVAAGTIGVVPFWPLPDFPTVSLTSVAGPFGNVTWTPDGQNLVFPARPGGAGPLRVQPLSGGGRPQWLDGKGAFSKVVVDPDERFAVAAGRGVAIFPLDGSEPIPLEGLDPRTACAAVAFDPGRQRIAAGVFKGSAAQKVIGVWDLDDGTYRALGPTDGAGDGVDGGYVGLVFAPDGSLLSDDRVALRRWNVDGGTSTVLIDGRCAIIGVDAGTNVAVAGCMAADGQADLMSIKLDSGEVARQTRFRFHSSPPSSMTYSPLGDAFAVGFDDGAIFVWPMEGGEPHLLLGHETRVPGLEFSPDGQFLASSGQDGAVRVWPVPDLSKPPLTALPRAELLAKLDTHTNVRMVRDPNSPNGWKIEIGPFPGWEAMPEW